MTPSERARFGRQMRLPEVGEAGQARLAGAVVSLHGESFVRTIAARYVERAGMRVDAEGSVAQGTLPAMPDLGLRHRAARDVADGAMQALVAARAALEIA